MPIATRTFRVFISSTFDDLKEERNALQREVFPKLRTLCEQHGARFQAIDMRWGVPDEAALDQQTMEICLREIERCQQSGLMPNFVVLLGDRYGWQPLPPRIEAEGFGRIRNCVTGADGQLIDDWFNRDGNADPPQYLLKSRTGPFLDERAWEVVEQKLHLIIREAAREAGLTGGSLVKFEAAATHLEILKGLETKGAGQHVFAFFRGSTLGAEEDPDLTALKRYLGKQSRWEFRSKIVRHDS